MTAPQTTVLGFRYSGPAFPFGPDGFSNFGPKDDRYVIYTSLINILTTPKGSNANNLNAGSWIPYLVFEPNDEVTRALLRYYTQKDLTEQEPRIVLRTVYTDQPDDFSVVLTVAFSIVGDPSGGVYNAPIPYVQVGS
jgi:phage baseplate assembly protein W